MLLCYIKNIPVFLTKKNVKNINIRVNRNGEVNVSAPLFCSNKKVKQFVYEKADWIEIAVQNRKKHKLNNTNFKQHKSLEDKQKIINKAMPILNKYQAVTGLNVNGLRARYMTSRWGSYSKKTNYITLNTQLLAYKDTVLEFIVIHELLHVKYFNHGQDFKSAMTKYFPSWKVISKELKN